MSFFATSTFLIWVFVRKTLKGSLLDVKSKVTILFSPNFFICDGVKFITYSKYLFSFKKDIFLKLLVDIYQKDLPFLFYFYIIYARSNSFPPCCSISATLS